MYTRYSTAGVAVGAHAQVIKIGDGTGDASRSTAVQALHYRRIRNLIEMIL